MRSALALVMVLVLTPMSVRAQDTSPPLRGPWADVLTPPRTGVTRRDARRLVRQGLFYLLQAIGPRSELDDAPWVHLERALLRFERARPLLSDDADLAYYMAVTLGRWERPGPDGRIERRVDDAVAAWRRLRELDPRYMPARVAFSLATLHARRLEIAEATAEYETVLATDVPEGLFLMGRTYLPNRLEMSLAGLYTSIDASLVHGNLAENLMLQGDLDRAIEHYRIGREGARGAMSRALMAWGLALALHRQGDSEAGLAAAVHAIEGNPFADSPREPFQRRWGALGVLHHPDVFFEPGYEVHAYQAIGYEAFAGGHASARATHLVAALTSWRRFLAEGGTSSRFAPHARAQIQRLEGAIGEAPRRAPWPVSPDRDAWGAGSQELWLGEP